MADKVPVKGGYNGGSLTGIAEYATGDTLGVAHGGTGVVTIGSNALVTGNGTSAMTSESNLTFDGTILKATGDLCATVKVVAPALCIGSEYVLPTADGSAGQLMCTDGSGALAFATASSGVTLAGSTNNTIATVTGSDALCGEANLTFDGTDLAIGNTAPSSYMDSVHGLIIGDTSDATSEIAIATTTTGTAEINFTDTADTTNQAQISYNHSNANLDFKTTQSGGVFKFSPDTGGSVLLQVGDASSNARVGIGTTAPDGKLHVHTASAGSVTANSAADELVIEGSGSQVGMQFLSPNDAKQFILFGDPDATNAGQISYTHDTNALRFYTSTAERMQIDTDGWLIVGPNMDTNSSTVGFRVHPSAGIGYFSADSSTTMYLTRISNTGTIIDFYQCVSSVGTISVGASSVAYNTSSDYRLKENVVDLTGAVNRVAQLQPHRFNFIADPDTTVDGFVAHEVSDIVPEAITGTKDGMQDVENVVVDADGGIVARDQTEANWLAGKEPTLVSEATDDEEAVYADPLYAADTVWHETLTVPDYQGIDQAKLVPLLTAAIQELTARVAALESA